MGKVKVHEDELERLCRLDGRVDAVQNYVNNCEYVSLSDVLDILGVDKRRMEERDKKETKAFKEMLEDEQ